MGAEAGTVGEAEVVFQDDGNEAAQYIILRINLRIIGAISYYTKMNST